MDSNHQDASFSLFHDQRSPITPRCLGCLGACPLHTVAWKFRAKGGRRKEERERPRQGKKEEKDKKKQQTSVKTTKKERERERDKADWKREWMCDPEEEVNRSEIHRSYGWGLHVPLSFIPSSSFSASHSLPFMVGRKHPKKQRKKEKKGGSRWSTLISFFFWLFDVRVWKEKGGGRRQARKWRGRKEGTGWMWRWGHWHGGKGAIGKM